MKGITSEIAAFIAHSRGAALPAAVARAGCRAYTNWMGCALGAVNDESVRKVRQVARAVCGGGNASLVGRAESMDAVNAALVNGVAANALDYDDMHAPTLIHPTGPVVAAALAHAEARHASGDVLLAGIIAGVEVECRLGLALFPAHYDAGWHITATLGTLGAAAASCVVLGLDAERTRHALGIAATQAGGLRAMLPNSCKSFNIGKAASAGALAALLAEADFDSEPDVLEAKFGLFHVFGARCDAGAVTRDLGTRWLIGDVSLKPYPCGIVIHPLIDGCIELARDERLRGGAVRSVGASVHPRAIELADRPHPESEITARYSLQHAAALALTRGSAGLDAFDKARIDDPALVALRNMMRIEGDAGLQPHEARVRVELASGTRLETNVSHPSGSPERPLTDAQLRDKFIELAVRAIPRAPAESLHESCMNVTGMEDVNAMRRHWASAIQGERKL
jgi:2-methylcitrate dehydratase PrpD